MGMLSWWRGITGKAKRGDENFAATFGSGSGVSGFAGASVSRLTASLSTWSGALNLDLESGLVILRARARQLAQSNEFGRRFLSLVATNVIGRNGPTLQVRAYRDQMDKGTGKPVLDTSGNDAVEVAWANWCKRADITGRMSFSMLQRVAIKAVARDGEALIRIVSRRNLPGGMALQLLEADRLDESLSQINPATGNTIRMGVEIDSTGAPLACWIKSRHPGDRYGSPMQSVERVPMDELLHVYVPERAEQVRGYSWFHAILLRAHQLAGFNDAAVLAARIGASKVATLTSSIESGYGESIGKDLADGTSDGTPQGIPQITAEGGEILDLTAFPGVKMESWNPDYPHQNFDSFVKAATRGISVGVDVADHNLSGDMSGVNYSSARIAEMSEREIWATIQEWWIGAVCEPVFRAWAERAFLRGEVVFEVSGKVLPAEKMQKFVSASRFQGRRWAWVDPAKEMEAIEKGLASRVTSRTRICAEKGEDFADILDELQAEEIALAAAGLKPAAPTAPATQPKEPTP